MTSFSDLGSKGRRSRSLRLAWAKLTDTVSRAQRKQQRTKEERRVEENSKEKKL